MDSLPSLNSISVFFSTNPLIFPAIAVAHAAVPQAFVNPAPLSQTLTLTKFLFITLARVTLHFQEKVCGFQFQVQFFSNQNFQHLLQKK